MVRCKGIDFDLDFDGGPVGRRGEKIYRKDGGRTAAGENSPNLPSITVKRAEV